MKAAIALCRNRIAPLFDVAHTFLLFDVEDPDGSESTVIIDSGCTREICRQLDEQGVHILLCGAASRVWREHLAQLGIEVHHGLAGDVQAIKRAFAHGRQAGLACFGMPGPGSCDRGRSRGGGWRRRRRHTVCDFDSLFKE